MDLWTEVGQIRLGMVAPLTMCYGVLGEKRAAFAVGLPVLLPRTS